MAYTVCTSNLDLVSFLFVAALYSTLKFEEFIIYLSPHVLCSVMLKVCIHVQGNHALFNCSLLWYV